MGLTTRELSRTGMEITRVGFGAWAVGGVSFGWGGQDDEDSIRAIRHAVDAGVNWIDTAAAYGHGHSEQAVGRAVRGIAEADRPFVFTKCGLNWDHNDPMGPHPRDLRPSEIRRGAEESLRASAWSASTCSSSTGQTPAVLRSRTPGPRWAA